MGSRYQNHESVADYEPEVYHARQKQAPTYGSAQPNSYAPVRPSAQYPPSYGVRPPGMTPSSQGGGPPVGSFRGDYTTTPPRQGEGPPLGSVRGDYTTTPPSQGRGPPLGSVRGDYTATPPSQGGRPPLGSARGDYIATPPIQGTGSPLGSARGDYIAAPPIQGRGPPRGSGRGEYIATPPVQGGGPPLGSIRGDYTATPPSQGGGSPLPYSVTDNRGPTRPAPARGQPRPSLPFDSQEPRPQSARPESGYARGGNPPPYGGRVGVSEPGYGRGQDSGYGDAPYDAGKRPVPVGLGDPGHVRPARFGAAEEVGLPVSGALLGRERGDRLPLGEESYGYGRGYSGADGYRQAVTDFDDGYDAAPAPISSEYAHENYVSVFTDPVYGGAIQYNPEGGFSEEPDQFRQMHYKEDLQRHPEQFDGYY